MAHKCIKIPIKIPEINSSFKIPKCMSHNEYWDITMHFISFNHPFSRKCFVS